MYQRVLTGLFLTVCTFTDLRGHYIDRRVVVAGMLLSAAGHVFNGISGHMPDMAGAALALLPGAGCLLLSLLTREALGYGDGMVMLVCGLALGMAQALELLFTGLFFSAVWAVFLCVFQKADRHRTFPFLPFLLAAFVVQTILSGYCSQSSGL